ncbi:TetR/AcrR family transcriptional regulator [Yinghuangia sp. ASG 101]|uniref:TetR/AcrR family transcriptional regulator n=1 Tax=Yinghuangia sp. ASG 101 TaxID=2896848 RepID=UPI001E4C8158|nr:TetR/AcrR family transcriptional regulator [Yinghuangia sp. ASG 101]UGQ12596.1 TetR/AcrR family transcriptional regulator [Yinghuangia sp. ASG 101]
MPAPARPRRDAPEPKTRTALVNAAMKVILDEGYAAVTTRRVAAEAGVNPALVHYHFRTIDDLFLAVFRRGAEAHLARLQAAAEGPEPLRGVWEVMSEPRDTGLTLEFLALANHRKAIRTELAEYSARFRELQEQALARVVRARGVTLDKPSLPALTLLLAGLPRILAMDDAVGLHRSRGEVLALVEEYLRRYDLPAAPQESGEEPDAGPD